MKAIRKRIKLIQQKWDENNNPNNIDTVYCQVFDDITGVVCVDKPSGLGLDTIIFYYEGMKGFKEKTKKYLNHGIIEPER